MSALDLDPVDLPPCPLILMRLPILPFILNASNDAMQITVKLMYIQVKNNLKPMIKRIFH